MMLRAVAQGVRCFGRNGLVTMPAVRGAASATSKEGGGSDVTAQVRHSHEMEHESPEAFDKRFEDFFNRPDLDGWFVRKGMHELHQYDLIPEPKIVDAALRACRRVNDIALAIRFLETVRWKCGPKVKEIWPYICQEIEPTMKELGIPKLEELGYEKPELWMPSVHFWEVDQHHTTGETLSGGKRRTWEFFEKNPPKVAHH